MMNEIGDLLVLLNVATPIAGIALLSYMSARQRQISKQASRLLRKLEHATKEMRGKTPRVLYVNLHLQSRWRNRGI
jgi:hypothetical protein